MEVIQEMKKRQNEIEKKKKILSKKVINRVQKGKLFPK